VVAALTPESQCFASSQLVTVKGRIESAGDFSTSTKTHSDTLLIVSILLPALLESATTKYRQFVPVQ
jgi:hypothetical protein